MARTIRLTLLWLMALTIPGQLVWAAMSGPCKHGEVQHRSVHAGAPSSARHQASEPSAPRATLAASARKGDAGSHAAAPAKRGKSCGSTAIVWVAMAPPPAVEAWLASNAAAFGTEPAGRVAVAFFTDGPERPPRAG